MALWERLRKEFGHAFALTPAGVSYSAEDDALFQKIAKLIIKRGLAAPALLFLESIEPLNFLSSQVVHGLKPFFDLACDPTELERFAVMLERRDSVDKLVSLIQEQTTMKN